MKRELLKKYLEKLDNLKHNHSELIDTNTDEENRKFEELIKLTAEICRDLKEIEETQNKRYRMMK